MEIWVATTKLLGIIGGTEQRETNMSHYNCCVPHCTNSFQNAPYLHYYRIPKDPDLLNYHWMHSVMKENFSIDDTSTSVEIETSLTGDLLNNLHDSLRMREQEIVKLNDEIHRLEKENKNIKEMNCKFQQEMKSSRHALDNNRFDITPRNISYEHKRTTLDSNVGRPRVLTKFQGFILVMLRLRLGLFEDNLAH